MSKHSPLPLSGSNPPDSLLSLHLPRRMGLVNWLGLWELYLKEVRRFTKIWLQTLAAPLVSSLLFLTIFVLALDPAARGGANENLIAFLIPGLAMMAMVQNAFANTSSSLIIGKIQGNIVDVLMPPLSPGELLMGFASAGVTRGLIVGVCVIAGMAVFAMPHIHSWGMVLFHAFGASLMMSLLGIIAGLWSDKFDHMAAVTNFIITPLSFLSGTFYTIDRLPQNFQFLAHFNPFFYMIDGFRFGFIGHTSALPLLSILVVGGIDLLLMLLAYVMIRTGYRIKS